MDAPETIIVISKMGAMPTVTVRDAAPDKPDAF